MFRKEWDKVLLIHGKEMEDNMTKRMTKAVAVSMACTMLAGSVGIFPADEARAAAGPKLSKKSITLKKGKSKKVQLKNKAGVKKIKWSVSNKKVVQLKGKSGAATVKGLKAGSAKLTCRFVYRGKSKKLVCKLIVKQTPQPKGGASAAVSSSLPSAAVPGTPAPAASQQPPVSSNPGQSENPAATNTPEPIPVMEDIDANATYDIQGSLKSALGRFFGNVGTSVNIFQLDSSQSPFQDDKGAMFEFTKNQYNSITPENESKPCRLLNMGTDFSDYFSTDFEAETMPVSEAKANKYYYVPDNYKEEVCPKINYSQFDDYMKKAAESGLRIRFHAFVWHQQTPKWLFKENYKADGDWVTPDVMNARMEYYIKSVIRYICMREEENGWGDVIYCYDVANEYFHNNDGKDEDGNFIKSYWDEVYYPDNKINEKSGAYTQTTEPVYIKSAFAYAREMLDSYGKQNVTLFYNDYNTYQVTENIISMVEYINKEGTICDGVGMQSHLDVSYPSVVAYTAALTKFLACDFIHEVQITELDVTAYPNKRKTLDDQMAYYYDLMKSILNVRKQYPEKMTGLTFWGLYDSFSWRRDGRPLLFESTSKAKGVYYKVLQAAAESEKELGK